MNRPKRRQVMLAAALGYLGAAALLWRGGEADDHSSGGGAAGTGDGQSLTISGELPRLLAPGDLVSLNLSFGNTHDRDLVIDQIKVTVTDVEAPLADSAHPCSLSDYHVHQAGADVTVEIEAGDTDDLVGLGVGREQWPAVGMLDSTVNQDGCKDATLLLTYEAQATEAVR